MENKKYIVNEELLPQILIKVVEAKKLLSQGKAKNSSDAARLAGISRSAFYKYKDGVSVFSETENSKILTYYISLMDNPGVLSNVLSVLSKNGANVLTINQNIPIDGAAPVTISFSSQNLSTTPGRLCELITNIDGVISCRSLNKNV